MTEGGNSALLVKFVDGIGIGELTGWVAGSGPKMIWETIDQGATYSPTFGFKKNSIQVQGVDDLRVLVD